MELYPHAKRTIGPAIEDGFYFDFDFGDTKVSEEDLPKIEEKMRSIVKTWDAFERIEVTADQAKKEYEGNPYKIELIEEFSRDGQKLTFYKSGNYSDLCRGGHVDYPKSNIKHFKLLSVAGAYWRGSEKNKMLTRIYGTCFKTKDELEKHLWQMEEAKKRDHRKIGQDLDLFVFSDLVGKGLPLWTPKGSVIRRELERFIVDEEIKRGYLHVYTPDLALLDLYKTSGHYPYYKDTMYAPLQIEDEQFMLRPMTCPHHFELYKSKPRSYRELPMRIAELAKLYRFEKSGELTGLMRVRSFCLADAHIVAKPDQATDVIGEVLDLIEYIASVFSYKSGEHYRYRLSLGDRGDDKKYYKDDTSWDYAESVLRDVLDKRKSLYYEAANEAAFYGPKIDVQFKNVAGKEETAFTVQYDFVMPKRFKLAYTDSDGSQKEPIVIHRSSIGAIERTIAFLIEHYAGNFPLWLSPIQASIIPIAERHNEAARVAGKYLLGESIRAVVADEQESMQHKIRTATLQKVPYMGIIGDKEIAKIKDQRSKSDDLVISVRKRDGKDLGQMAFPEFLKILKSEIENKH
jgi:threonyl-tRNA synthetase